MNTVDLLYIWSDSPGISIGTWFVVLVTVLYFGRLPAHNLIHYMTRALRNAFRMTAKSSARLEQRLDRRNKEIVLSDGKAAVERVIEREMHRVNVMVARDLSGYPAVQRKISDAINKIEEDYRHATETPPSPPAWLEAIETVAKIPRNGDPTIAKILGDIQDTLDRAHRETLADYRKNSLKRHDLLKRMLPSWRELSQNMAEVSTNIDGLEKRSKHIDNQMKLYEQIRAADDKAVRALTSSSLTQFFIAGLVLFIAVLGGVINFQLIALPMSEMVGGTSQLGSIRTADIAALVIIMLEIAMGLFLMESLRITRLFPIIGTMDDKMRRRMMFITFAILTILASVEASLAYMRDLLAADREALSQSLAGLAAVQPEFRWIPSIGQMVMGFILPFALAFVAIPLESFIHAVRTALGLIGALILRVITFALRLMGNVFYHAGHVLTALYDVVIFLPIQLERMYVAQKNQPKVEKVEDAPLKKSESSKGV